MTVILTDSHSKNGVTNTVSNTYGSSNAKKGWIENRVTVVSEPGFYRLIFMSRKPEAEKIKHWVFHEVLPSIRKYGYYRIQQPEQEKIHVKITGREKFNMLKEKFPEIDFSDAFGVIDTVKRYDSNGYYNEESVHHYYLYMNPTDYEKLRNEPFLFADKFLERIIPRRTRKKKNIKLPADSLE